MLVKFVFIIIFYSRNVLNIDMLQKSNEKLEKELTQAMEKCKKLVENLENMAVTLKEREVVLQAKELEVAQEMAKCENMTDILKEREAVVRAKELKVKSFIFLAIFFILIIYNFMIVSKSKK